MRKRHRWKNDPHGFLPEHHMILFAEWLVEVGYYDPEIFEIGWLDNFCYWGA
jgi:hypothetical protein